MMNVGLNIILGGANNPQTNSQCGLPQACCCGGDSFTIKQGETDYRFFNFDYNLLPREKDGLRYEIKDIIDMYFEDATGVQMPVFPRPSPIDLSLITASNPLLIGTSLKITEALLWDGKDSKEPRRGIRLRIEALSTSNIGEIYKFNYKFRAINFCGKLDIEYPDCGMIRVIKC